MAYDMQTKLGPVRAATIAWGMGGRRATRDTRGASARDAPNVPNGAKRGSGGEACRQHHVTPGADAARDAWC